MLFLAERCEHRLKLLWYRFLVKGQTTRMPEISPKFSPENSKCTPWQTRVEVDLPSSPIPCVWMLAQNLSNGQLTNCKYCTLWKISNQMRQRQTCTIRRSGNHLHVASGKPGCEYTRLQKGFRFILGNSNWLVGHDFLAAPHPPGNSLSKCLRWKTTTSTRTPAQIMKLHNGKHRAKPQHIS